MGLISSMGSDAPTSIFGGSRTAGAAIESTSKLASRTFNGGSCSSCERVVASLSRESRTRSRRSSIRVSS